jgi:hypothetical protein
MGQGGKPESEGVTAVKDEVTDTEFGSTTDGRDGHATRPVEGQGTSMRAEGPQQGTDGDGRMTPMRGEYEENYDEDSWHGARKDGRETAAFGKANDGTGMEPEEEAEGPSSEEKGSKIGMTDSDGTRSGHGSVVRDKTTARTKKRPEKDPPHLVRRPRLFG